MAGRETADIVFCMDASGSMAAAFDGVRDNVIKMLESIKGGGLQQRNWDVRFDFLAYSNSSGLMRLHTLRADGDRVVKALYGGGPNGGRSDGSFFTSDLREFRDRLKSVRIEGDEGSMYALDIAADFPFRDASTCHRVVVFMTDETIAEGVDAALAKARVMDVARKYQDRRIALYMITPQCDVFDTLSQTDRCEWTVDSSRGLESLDFSKTLECIGKSVSVSQTAKAAGADGPCPLFEEKRWRQSGFSPDYVNVVTSGRGEAL